LANTMQHSGPEFPSSGLPAIHSRGGCLSGAPAPVGASTGIAFAVKLKTEEPNFQLAHIISWDHARYAAT
jgi:hypothetical protein